MVVKGSGCGLGTIILPTDSEGWIVGVNKMMAGPEVGMATPMHMLKAVLGWKLGREKGESQSAWLGKNAIATSPKEQEHTSVSQHL